MLYTNSIIQGFWYSAIIPSTFAGTHANSVFIFSAWFLFEKWKSKHVAEWTKYKNRLLTSPGRVRKTFKDGMKEHISRIKESMNCIGERMGSWFATGTLEDVDVETGTDTRNQTDSTGVAPDALKSETSGQEKGAQSAASAHSGFAVATLEAADGVKSRLESTSSDQLKEVFG